MTTIILFVIDLNSNLKEKVTHAKGRGQFARIMDDKRVAYSQN